ncbi:DUF4158 domain-containing protein [Brumicola pallidula]|uniref:Tn3 transposase DDE domain-containing protein n=1 Tax=Brumicola pallidula DSM 14239 = ACAM 615 TaxID=1121922 RepID=K6Y805_9ALTE|nr:DUF4158 domain-containing protein [Glaciecola pallidula]GAC28884.1 hypothetical protein GPAL_2023 [Glaciecola pallidula DSM 14239 = ACAM 615]
MAIKNELSILTKAEQADLYSPPTLSLEQQRLYFTPNEIELTELKSFRLRNHRCYFIALLGYFKSKPIILAPSFSLIFDDMQFISAQIQGSKGIRPFSVNKVQRDRIYLRILRLLNYQKWDESRHFTPLFDHLVLIGNAWLEPRYLFDTATEYLALHRIAIPKYTVLQRLISRVIQHVKKSLNNTLRQYVQRALNRGEAWHFLRRAIASVNRDQFRGKNETEIVIWNECARLTANAIIYFNSMVLSHLLLHFKEVGDEEKAAITRQVSPAAWQNINMSGTYQFANDHELPDLQPIAKPIVDNSVQKEK